MGMPGDDVIQEKTVSEDKEQVTETAAPVTEEKDSLGAILKDILKLLDTRRLVGERSIHDEFAARIDSVK